MSASEICSGFLDVKRSSRSRRGFTPWKAWQKQWCEIKRTVGKEDGLELKLKSAQDGSVQNCLFLPTSSTICRTESRTKQYAFGVFTVGRNQKPLIFLSGNCESDTQNWMASIRKMLCIASYLPVGKSNFHVSLIDNQHSRAAGIIGLHGVLSTNPQDIVISDPCTGETKVVWKWHQFHHFHLQAPVHTSDDKKICVIHTSKEFPAGPGQLLFHCKQAAVLLNHLVARGNAPVKSGFVASKRLSRSEGDLCASSSAEISGLRSHSGSDDSGVRVSGGSESDSGGYLVKTKNVSSYSVAIGVLMKTPGGSETNADSVPDLSIVADTTDSSLNGKGVMQRRESGVSLASGIYEEISENPPSEPQPKKPHADHIYENPIELIERNGETKPNPPPLPRRNDSEKPQSASKPKTSRMLDLCVLSYKQRCSTLPAKDLARISQMFTAESEDYVVMSPSKTLKKTCENVAESIYMPMSPAVNVKTKIGACLKTEHKT